MCTGEAAIEVAAATAICVADGPLWSAATAVALAGTGVVVGGSVGHLSGFMAQTGRLVVCGDAGEALGDSLYEARLYVRGEVAALGADCVEKELREEHVTELSGLLEQAGIDGLEPKSVKKKLKQPSFAAGVHRDEVYAGAEGLGLELDDHIRNVVEAMQPIASELGLRTGADSAA
jgi:hypothetical protein